ncbi:hypothetical protein F0L68_34310 [Solihabitans fulvus]|uniref:2-keto-4-pentenoate hydratase n=1 Tax=Solihabitans fulvus TaxID=1892852 RepID=A0A5B2WPY4_9PSEU|nr:hypothetical protein [Solihabitans fulvus]KAA2252840.1 hypothetical protein F0L68_34310 [Solihabitans fulvus]
MTHVAEKTTPRGYRLSAPGGPVVAVHSDALVTSPVPLAAVSAARLRPSVAVLLGRELAAGAPPGAVERAIGAAFVAVEVSDPDGGPARFVLGERAVELPLGGPLTLWQTGTDAEVTQPESFGDLVTRVGAAAGEAGGLPPGAIVLVGPIRPGAGLPARPGTVQLWGPGFATVIVAITSGEEAGA